MQTNNNFNWENYTWDVIDSFFADKKVLIKHQIDSYNHFIDTKLQKIVNEFNPIISHYNYNPEIGKYMTEYHVTFGDISISKPIINDNEGEITVMYPNDARLRNLSYSSVITCNIYQKIIRINEKTNSIEELELPIIKNISIGKMPIMLHSKYCVLSEKTNKTQMELGECEFDQGGYFIINGSEKVIVSFEKKCENKIFVFQQSRGLTSTYSHIAEITSISPENSTYVKPLMVKLNSKDGNFFGKTIRVQITKVKADIPLFVIFRALGIISDKEIIEYIVYDVNNDRAKELMEKLKPSLEESSPIVSKKIALEYISKYIVIPINIKGGNQSIESKLNYVEYILLNEILPHVGKSPIKKAYFLGLMVRKLLYNYLEYSLNDDRDSFINKRVESPGVLMGNLFKLNFSKLVKDLKILVDKDIKNGRIDEISINISKKIKSNIIELGLKYALATGNWGEKGQKNKKGVAQVLGRLSYLSSLSHRRRIIAPIEKNCKQTAPRKLHNTQWMRCCSCETPEGGSIGIVKNMALSCQITIDHDAKPILDYLDELDVIPLEQVQPRELLYFTIVIINGDWVGIIKDPNTFVTTLKSMRRKGIINIYTSIAWNINANEININTDAGRLIRPLYIVENNNLNIDSELCLKLRKKELHWNDLLTDIKLNKTIIEYIDTQEEDTIMVAMTYQNIRENSDKNVSFFRYTHCELHPSLQLGVLASNIPFAEHNAGPRNIFLSAQGKQAIGIYATNFNKRMDTIAHILHYPQKPLIHTRMSIHANSNELPSGQNAIVAIAAYYGYNQEDSLIMNQSALDRGLFTTSSYRTHKDEEKKNQATLEEEKFCKPEKYLPNGDILTRGMKQGSYDKLNENGLIKIGSKVEGDDVIIGKILPLKQLKPNEPKFKDASVNIKPSEAGYADWVYSNKNGEGYKFAKVRIRTDKIPENGDKHSCYDDKTEILTSDGFKYFKDLTMNDKIATLVDGEKIEYNNPINLYVYDDVNEMYEYNSNNVNLCITLNHNVYAKLQNEHFKLEKIENIMGNKMWMKKNANNCNNKIDRFIYKNINIDMDIWLEFFGLWISEGSLDTNYKFVGISIYKDIVLSKLINISNKFGLKFNYDKTTNRYVYYDIDLFEYLSYFSKLNEKYLPDYIWNLSQQQCNILLNSLLCYDEENSANITDYYYTGSEKLADDLQRLCFHSGLSGNKILKKQKEEKLNIETTKKTDQWIVTVIRSTMNNPILNSKNNFSEKIIEYNGKVYCCEVPSNIIYVRRNGICVWSGNSRHGQKGTIGMALPQEDMPYTKEGIVPDIIVNPAAIPSRMTLGQLIECVLGKACVLKGCDADATPFTGIDVEQIADILESVGYERYGTEILYNGRTGEQLKARIFIGPTYYYRLKHLVSDKQHSRATGPYQILTKQASEGRSRGGGLRVGEMEKDCMLAHGCSYFLKERLFDVSDKYLFFVCKNCGMVAIANQTKNLYKCTYCDNTTNFSKVQVPYSTKLLWQELMSIGIAPKLLT